MSLVSKRFVYFLFDIVFTFLSIIFRKGRGREWVSFNTLQFWYGLRCCNVVYAN